MVVPCKCLECAGFKIDFVFEQLKRIVLANYATDTEIYRNKRLYKIRREMDNISGQIEDLTARKDKLIKDTRDIISTAHDSDRDSSSNTDFCAIQDEQSIHRFAIIFLN